MLYLNYAASRALFQIFTATRSQGEGPGMFWTLHNSNQLGSGKDGPSRAELASLSAALASSSAAMTFSTAAVAATCAALACARTTSASALAAMAASSWCARNIRMGERERLVRRAVSRAARGRAGAPWEARHQGRTGLSTREEAGDTRPQRTPLRRSTGGSRCSHGTLTVSLCVAAPAMGRAAVEVAGGVARVSRPAPPPGRWAADAR